MRVKIGIQCKSRGNKDIDQNRKQLYIEAMTEKQTQAAELELNKLEYRIEELVQVCDRLKEENQSLRSREESLATERANLIEKNEQVRARVEAMINRLRAMETRA